MLSSSLETRPDGSASLGGWVLGSDTWVSVGPSPFYWGRGSTFRFPSLILLSSRSHFSESVWVTVVIPSVLFQYNLLFFPSLVIIFQYFQGGQNRKEGNLRYTIDWSHQYYRWISKINFLNTQPYEYIYLHVNISESYLYQNCTLSPNYESRVQTSESN